jgi:hypothetical protein
MVTMAAISCVDSSRDRMTRRAPARFRKAAVAALKAEKRVLA